MYLVGLHIYYKMIHGPNNVKWKISYGLMFDLPRFKSIYECFSKRWGGRKHGHDTISIQFLVK